MDASLRWHDVKKYGTALHPSLAPPEFQLLLE